MTNFVESLNISRLTAMLENECDPARRVMLVNLRTEAEQRLRDNPDTDPASPKLKKG
jgi:hypothetical protein